MIRMGIGDSVDNGEADMGTVQETDEHLVTPIPEVVNDPSELVGATRTKVIEQFKAVPKRLVVIETDGNGAKIVLAEVAGTLELIKILESLLAGFSVGVK